MTSHDVDGFRLTVLNPKGRDPEQEFRELPAPGEAAVARTGEPLGRERRGRPERPRARRDRDGPLVARARERGRA